ncbi:hypothetical protein ACLESO_41650 [Pyxidicoccus sp. 3LG]
MASVLGVLFFSPLASAESAEPGGVRTNTARLMGTDAAEVIDAPVLGLQRTALPLFGGLAVDTSLYADAMLAPNLGLRWAVAAGPHRFVLGARYTHFVGASTYSDIVTSETPALRSFEPELSGPSFYGVYGLALGPLLVQARRATRTTRPTTSPSPAASASTSSATGPWWARPACAWREAPPSARRPASATAATASASGWAPPTST